MKIKSSHIIMVLLLLSIFCRILLNGYMNDNNPYPMISQTEVINKISEIESVIATDTELLIKIKGETYICKPTNPESLVQQLYVNNVNYKAVDKIPVKVGSDLKKFSNIMLVISIIILFFAFLLNSFKKSFNSNFEKNDIFKSMTPDMSLNIGREIPKVTFNDVQGCEELKEDAKLYIDTLKNPYQVQLIGARAPKGLILYGPPGTGKTLIAKAIAGTAGVPFLNVSGSDFVEMYVGVGSKRVKELFATARKLAPCIVFIDEIDAVGGKRGKSQNTEKDQTINTLLTELDGFKDNSGVIVIAATNRLDMLDSALTRPGRFDSSLSVPLPTKQDRYNILKLHSKNKKFDETVDLKVIAAQTPGFSGAELETLLNEASLNAIKNKKKFVNNEDIDNAFFKLVMKGNVSKNQKDRRKDELDLVAWHEAGHTLVTKLLTKEEVTKVTILSSTSGAGGVTFVNPDEQSIHSKEFLENKICISYGGRAAEEIFFGNPNSVTTGASGDIQNASKMIRNYILKYGMSSKFGLLDVSVFNEDSTSSDLIIDEATRLANELYNRTLECLNLNKDKLEILANALLEKETLLNNEIDELIGLKESYNNEVACTVTI